MTQLRDGKLPQELVDERRVNIMVQRAFRLMQEGKPFPPPSHIWYPEPRIGQYEERKGNAPPDSERPAWLKGLTLWLDCEGLGPQVLWDLRPGGEMAQALGDSKRQRNIDLGKIDVVSPQITIHSRIPRDLKLN